MQLVHINKTQYRKNLNNVIAGFIITLLVLALLFGQILIAGFGQEGVSNFKYNLLGVILALSACAAILSSLKNSVYFKEIYYVWQLKQFQNSIYRKLTKIKTAAENNEENALLILLFYYQSLKQVYELDDNTLTITKVYQELNEIEETISNKSLDIEVTHFDKSLIDLY